MMLAVVSDRAAVALVALNVVLIAVAVLAAIVEWIMPRRRWWLLALAVVAVAGLAANTWRLIGQLAA